MRVRPARSILLLALWLSAAAAAAADFHEETLDNGLRVILIPHHANPMIASSVIVGAGVVYEPPGMSGASHFLEHLLFNGTARRSQKELYDEVDLYGAYNNATTREDHTLFQLLIQKEFAAAGLDIQADMLFHSTLPPDKFDKEKGIVLEELARDRNDARYLAGAAFRSFAYEGTPLGRPVLGSASSIEGLERADVLAYYKSRYVPGNMTLVVVGDLEVGPMMETVRATFGTAAAAPPPARPAAAWPPRPEQNARTMPLDGERTFLFAAAPLGLAPHDPRLTAAELWIEALAGGADAPLALALENDPELGRLAIDHDLSVVPRIDGWTTLELQATLPDPGKAPAVLSRVASWLERLGDEAVRGRLPRVRRVARAEAILLADQIHYTMMMRSPYALGAPASFIAGDAERFDELTDEQVEAARVALGAAPAGLRVLLAGPGVSDGRQRWDPPAPPPPPPGDRLAATLESGMRVGIERNDDSRVFAVHLMLRPRSASEPEGKTGIADMLHRMFLRGTASYDRAALAARLDELGAQLKVHDSAAIPYDDYYTTPEFSFLRLQMPSDRWREAVALLAEIVLHPRLDPDDLEDVRQEMLDGLRRADESTRERAGALFDRTLAPGHPLSRPPEGTLETVSSITLHDLRAFHAAYVTGRRTVYSQVGPVDPAAALAAVREAFAGLEPGAEPPSVPTPPVTAPGLEATDSLGKEQAQIVMGYVFDADPDDLVALGVAGTLLSKRLGFELREKRGLAYSIGASIGPWGGRERLRIGMGTRQDNVDEALAGIREQVRKFAEGEPDADEVRRAANALRGRLLMRRMTRVNQAYFMGLAELDGHAGLDTRERLDALLGVGAEDVRRVLRRYLDADRAATVVVR